MGQGQARPGLGAVFSGHLLTPSTHRQALLPPEGVSGLLHRAVPGLGGSLLIGCGAFIFLSLRLLICKMGIK